MEDGKEVRQQGRQIKHLSYHHKQEKQGKNRRGGRGDEKGKNMMKIRTEEEK